MQGPTGLNGDTGAKGAIETKGDDGVEGEERDICHGWDQGILHVDRIVLNVSSSKHMASRLLFQADHSNVFINIELGTTE